MRTYIEKPTDTYVTSFDSMFEDSLTAMVNCMIAVAKDRITKEINDYYPNAEIIAIEGKFLADAATFKDLICDYDKAAGCYGTDEDFKYFRKELKKAAQFIRDDAGDRHTLRRVLEDMFSECEDRKEYIDRIVDFIFII